MDFNDFKDLAIVIGLLWVGLFLLLTPVAFLDGCAKSAILKKTRGIDIPWYQAAWIDFNFADARGEVIVK
jgi:hypothetical protein